MREGRGRGEKGEVGMVEEEEERRGRGKWNRVKESGRRKDGYRE